MEKRYISWEEIHELSNKMADMKMLMPPKSTWFEPKLADGMLSLKI